MVDVRWNTRVRRNSYTEYVFRVFMSVSLCASLKSQFVSFRFYFRLPSNFGMNSNIELFKFSWHLISLTASKKPCNATQRKGIAQKCCSGYMRVHAHAPHILLFLLYFHILFYGKLLFIFVECRKILNAYPEERKQITKRISFYFDSPFSKCSSLGRLISDAIILQLSHSLVRVFFGNFNGRKLPPKWFVNESSVCECGTFVCIWP